MMRSPTPLDGSATESDERAPLDGPGTMSDAAVQRLLTVVLGVLGAAAVVGLFAAAAIWALGANEEEPPPMNAVDVGFLQDMIDHHEQALLISNLYLDDNPEGPARAYAREVIMFQERDLGWMRDWLAEENYQEGEPGRIAMVWMDEPTPLAEMRGMQSPARLQELDDATGADADRLFFELMTDHHLGGVHMADHAAANGQRPDIVDFAAAVARNQRIEVVEYESAMQRLGLT